MAAAVTSAWSKKPGAWALDSEEHEHELKNDTLTLASAAAAAGDAADFPSLMASVTTKAKKKKPVPMSLAEFASSKPAPKTLTLTHDDRISLPTGPRQRTAEELADRTRLGGGFRSYGQDRGSEEPRKREGFAREPLGPSRADEADDWGSMKRPVERRERGFFGSSDSKADESDNWGSNKSFVPSSDGRRFDNSRERRVGFGTSGAADTENWLRKKDEEGGKRFGGGSGGAFDSLRERKGGFGSGDSDNWGKKNEEGSVGSARPRLNLQPRTVPVGEQNGSGVVAAKPKGSNPFGEARPREEVLKEKGQDWKEIDEKLEAMRVKEVEVSSPGKRGFGGSNGRGPGVEVRAEGSWRKPDSADVRPQSADEVENGVAEKAQDSQE